VSGNRLDDGPTMGSYLCDLYMWELQGRNYPLSLVLHTVPGTCEALRKYLLSENV